MVQSSVSPTNMKIATNILDIGMGSMTHRRPCLPRKDMLTTTSGKDISSTVEWLLRFDFLFNNVFPALLQYCNHSLTNVLGTVEDFTHKTGDILACQATNSGKLISDYEEWTQDQLRGRFKSQTWCLLLYIMIINIYIYIHIYVYNMYIYIYMYLYLYN